ncbi:MAG TPA: hypothetical protein VMC41_00005, partial [Candidatus Nanoarchaeia archaeon]|nr:hypothetical protein [Candidatus Nanoarchaeia archaeon]
MRRKNPKLNYFLIGIIGAIMIFAVKVPLAKAFIFGSEEIVKNSEYLTLTGNFHGTWDGYATNTLPYLANTTKLEPFWRAASTTLSVSNFASANISQWINDSNYLANNGNFHGTWSGLASTSFALGSSLNSYLLKSASTSIPGYLNSNAGNWAGTWQNKDGSDFLASSTIFIANNLGDWAGTWQTYNPSHFLANSASTSIPGLILSASSSQWNSFFHTPSGQISLGAGLSWTGNSIGIGSGYTLPPTTGYHNTKWDAIVTASTSLPYLANTTELEPFWRAASTSLTVANFSSPNISQWTNDLNYLINNGNFHGTWSGLTSTTLPYAPSGTVSSQWSANGSSIFY